jgi:hypothetical protein
MLNAKELTICSFSTYHQDAEGQVFVFFSITAAAEVAVDLATLVSILNLGLIDIANLKNFFKRIIPNGEEFSFTIVVNPICWVFYLILEKSRKDSFWRHWNAAVVASC